MVQSVSVPTYVRIKSPSPMASRRTRGREDYERRKEKMGMGVQWMGTREGGVGGSGRVFFSQVN